jgi:1,4-dihydroxy-2-naphthoyl-CoA hydrolase
MATLTVRTKVRLSDTDAAGLLFFAKQFVYAHDAYEFLMQTVGYSLLDIIEKESFLLPIVHAEADYLKKLNVGEEIDVTVSIARIGNTSFTLAYEVSDRTGRLVGRASTVHVSVDKQSQSKIDLPPDLRQALQKLLDAPHSA